MNFAVQNQLVSGSLILPDNGQTSVVIPLNGLTLVGVMLPAGIVSTALTFTMSDAADGTFVPVYGVSGAISYTISASKYFALDPKDFQGIAFIKLVFGSSETGGPLTIKYFMKGL